MTYDLRTRASKIAASPWVYAPSDITATIHELLSKIPASKTCPRCNGTGSPPPVGMNDGRMVYYYPCPGCWGKGEIPVDQLEARDNG